MTGLGLMFVAACDPSGGTGEVPTSLVPTDSDTESDPEETALLETESERETGTESETESETGLLDTGPADVPTETVPEAPVGCPVLFDGDVLLDLRLEFTAEDWAAIEMDYATGVQAWHPARFTWVAPTGDEWVVDDAAVRLRGNPGFSWLGPKMQFLIGFDVYADDGRFFGQRRLALDASWYHPSLLRDRLAYQFLRDLGVPAPCANHATLTVDGAYYGLYTQVEVPDRELLERVFGPEEAGGALYEGGWDPDANAEAADPYTLAAYWADPSVAAQEASSDLAANVLEWAAEAVIPQADGYWCCAHNFYLYDHPTRGFLFLPWDLDYAFDSAPWSADPDAYYRDSDNQPHLDALSGDAVWREAWIDAVARATEAYDPDTLGARIDTWSAQIGGAMAVDPNTTHTIEAHEDGVERLRAFVDARRGYLDGWVGCARGGADGDGDGWGACDDCDDGDAALHPGASEVCNRRDDDCNGWADDGGGCDVCDEVSFGSSRFLVCSEPMTWVEANERCLAEGAALGAPATTEEWYLLVYETYWQDEAWSGITDWWAGPAVGAACSTLTPASWTTRARPCGERLPAICRR